jgi:uncharacterized membrane protein
LKFEIDGSCPICLSLSFIADLDLFRLVLVSYLGNFSLVSLEAKAAYLLDILLLLSLCMTKILININNSKKKNNVNVKLPCDSLSFVITYSIYLAPLATYCAFAPLVCFVICLRFKWVNEPKKSSK